MRTETVEFDSREERAAYISKQALLGMNPTSFCYTRNGKYIADIRYHI